MCGPDRARARPWIRRAQPSRNPRLLPRKVRPMRRLILGGLSIALGCLVANVHAQELQWRPASPHAAAGKAQPPATAPLPQHKPLPLESGAQPAAVAPVVPVAF